LRSSTPPGYHALAAAPPADALAPDREASERGRAWVLLGAALAVGLLVRGYLALTDAGIYWPDEIYQSLEPAHALVFGYGLIPWEFIQGARSWALPGALAGIWELLRAVGLGAPRYALPLFKLLFAGVGVWTAWATWRLARACGASPLASALGGAAFALAGLAVYFAPRAMSETACALPATLGLALSLDPSSARGKRLLGAALLALSVFLRLQCGLFCVGLLAILAARRRWRPLWECLAVLAVGALLFGLLDRLTWGEWFHSALVYLRFNLIDGKASAFGTADSGYYLRYLFRSMPVLSAVALALALLGARRAWGLAALCFGYLFAHSLIPHKELRFLFPFLPLLFALAAVGLSQCPERWRRAALALFAFATLASAVRFHRLTFGDLGAYRGAREATSAFDDFGPLNRLLTQAGERPDLCGIWLPAHLAWTGGATYLGKQVPVYGPGKPGPRGAFNYQVVMAPHVRGEVARDGAFALVKLTPGPCVKDPTYSWRLP
jgi:hypothetical protein